MKLKLFDENHLINFDNVKAVDRDPETDSLTITFFTGEMYGITLKWPYTILLEDDQ